MGLTLRLDEQESARVSEESIGTHPPDQVEFVAEGLLTVTEELLGEFEGTTLKPTRVALAVGESDSVTVDLTAEPSLRLEEVDVGVATPDTADLSAGVDSLDPRTDERAETPDLNPGAVAFTVEGSILNLPEATFKRLSEGEMSLQSITFALEETAKSDGGSNDTVLVEVTLIGFGIVIYRNGIIEIGTPDGATDIELP